MVVPFLPPLLCASRIFLLGRYDNPLSISLSYSLSIRRHLLALNLLSLRIYTVCMTSLSKSILTDQKPLHEPAAVYTSQIGRNLRYSITVNRFFSSITSELFAILHALYLVYSLKIKVVNVTDSLSSLPSITNCKWKKQSFTNKIALLRSTLSAACYEIRFLCVPAHQNIPRNEIADQLAKLSTAEPSPNPPNNVL